MDVDPHGQPRAIRRPAWRSVVRAALASGAIVGAALLSSCSGDDGGPAEVTLPKLDTTTTTSMAPGPDRAQGRREPLPPAWTVQFGGPGADVPLGLVGSDDSIVVTGSTAGEIVLRPADGNDPDGPGAQPATSGPTVGGADALVAVIDTEGVVRSIRTTGSDGDDVAAGVAAGREGLTTCGNTTGQFGATAAGSSDIWCSPIEPSATHGDSRGAEGTQPHLLFPGLLQMGGPDAETITAVAGHEGEERVYAVGATTGLLPGAQDPTGRGLGAGDALTVQLGAGGAPVWARQFGTPVEDGANGVAVTSDGDALAVGYTDGDLGRASSGGRDAWITRFDPGGRQRWMTQFGTSGSDELTSVTVTGEARRGTQLFVAAGSTDGDLDAATTSRPAESGPGESVPDRGPTDDGAPHGANEVAPGSAGRDAFAAGFGADGTLMWTTTVASDGDDRGTAVVADGSTVYLAGTTDGDLGELLGELGPGGGSDGFLAALDTATGELLWVARFGSSADEVITGITTTEDGFLVLSGTTTGRMAQGDPAGAEDAFLVAFPLAAAGGGAASSV